MDEKIEKVEQAIVKLAELAQACQDAQKSQYFSQASLNLVHVRNMLLVTGKK